MSARLKSIVEKIQVGPDDEILEIGCGHGVAAEMICAQLKTGHFLGLDRSEKMIAAARQRNRRFIAGGNAEFIVADFLAFDPGSRRFQTILAVRIGAFHREPVATRSRVERWLAPGGKLFVVYDQP